MSLGNRLKRMREVKKLSQIEAAEKLRLSNGVLSNYERDYRDPDTGTLAQMAKLYNVSTDYLLGLIDIPETVTREVNFQRMMYKTEANSLDEQIDNMNIVANVLDDLISFESPQTKQLKVYVQLMLDDLKLKKTIEMLQKEA